MTASPRIAESGAGRARSAANSARSAGSGQCSSRYARRSSAGSRSRSASHSFARAQVCSSITWPPPGTGAAAPTRPEDRCARPFGLEEAESNPAGAIPPNEMERSSRPFCFTRRRVLHYTPAPMKHLVLVTLLIVGLVAEPAALASWTATGSLSVARTQHAAVRLADGRVLATGGITATATTSTAEIFDSAAGTWSPAASMVMPRSRHTATLLPDNRVLVTGGRLAGASLASAEIYDPAAGTWSLVAAMHSVRDSHTATLLDNGRVLVTGGVSGGDGGSPVEKSAEIYDPAGDTWTIADHMFAARYNQQATRLSDGRVLVTGGFNISISHIPSRDAEIYDPAADRWSQARNMGTPRATHVAFLLADGRVAVVGGWTQPPNAITLTATAEIYDAVTNTW